MIQNKINMEDGKYGSGVRTKAGLAKLGLEKHKKLSASENKELHGFRSGKSSHEKALGNVLKGQNIEGKKK